MFDGHYEDWREKRIDFIVGNLGKKFFLRKKLIEVGAGYGHIGEYFNTLGAEVVCCDAKDEHVKVMMERFRGVKNLRAKKNNLEIGFPEGNWDIVVHMGVLYHLRHPIDSFYKMLPKIKQGGILILESEVTDSDQLNHFKMKLEEGYDQSYIGKGKRLSAPTIEKLLNICFEWERYDDPALNSGPHCYDWKVTNSGKAKHGRRRFWIAKKFR